MKDRLRAYGLCASLLVGAGIFLSVVHRHYAVDTWLFWRYAGYWLWSLLFAAACLGAGHLAVRRLGGRLRLDQHLVFAFALGVLIFYLGMFVAGLLQLYGPVFAVAWPLALVAGGAPSLVRHARPRLRRLWRQRLSRAQVLALAPVAAFGLVGAGMLYFLILTPDNIAYDARWYHLGLAEQYAIHGGVRRFEEGWYQAAFPHLASYLYTWAFQVPGTQLFDRLELAAHLEFVIFLATLSGIPALVRWLAPGVKARFAWAALFLFPGIFLYDSTLSAAADHIAALWAIPIYLALVRAWPSLAPRRCLLLAAMMAGAISTKYQSLSLLAFPMAAVVGRGLWLVAHRQPRALAGLAVAAAAGLVLTMPHWLKNWVWYGDPLYPHLHQVLRGHPWNPDAGPLVERVFTELQMWRPKGTLGARLRETATAMFTFSFVPHDWPTFHGKVPVFGSLFTLSLLALPFLRGARRLWPLVLATELGVFVYHWTSHQDRYLQIILPWMVVVTAAVLALAWRAGWLARGGVALLVGLQIVWGGDVYFLPTHAMVGGSPITSTVTLLSSGYRKDKDRLRRLGPFFELGEKLPPKSKLLLHETHMITGLGVPVVSDWGGWQGGISYGRLGSPRGVHQALRKLGVTHLAWRSSKDWDSLAGDLLFFDLAGSLPGHQVVGGFNLAPLPAEPPDFPGWNDRVLVLGCAGGLYEPGLYRLEQVTLPQVAPGDARPKPLAPYAEGTELPWDEVRYAAIELACHTLPEAQAGNFRTMTAHGKLQLLVRTTEPSNRPAAHPP
jgi:hypothetical protein